MNHGARNIHQTLSTISDPTDGVEAKVLSLVHCDRPCNGACGKPEVRKNNELYNVQ